MRDPGQTDSSLLLSPRIGQGLGEAGDCEVRRRGAIRRNDAGRQEGEGSEQAGSRPIPRAILSEKRPPSAVPAGRHGGSVLLRNLRYLSPTLCIARTNFTLRHSPLPPVYSLLTSQPHRFAVESASAGGYQNYFCESGWMKPVAFHISTLDVVTHALKSFCAKHTTATGGLGRLSSRS
jgi:hypothetical protein